MSGDFADRQLACLSSGRAPSIYVPSERWFRGHHWPWRPSTRVRGTASTSG